ncbi:hypothetical protein GCM10009775_27290 [Microbacterium aoyamense]|uniref:Regulatory protein RecX n=1 Tax=Microbacterium aoyamense TaxID=344166 RepID=A0ABN2PY95_9MICO|nr:regulatory protein RecX [Microbacterium aoyamense]
MTVDRGGEHDELAPVIPIFGGPPPERPISAVTNDGARDSRSAAARPWHASWIEEDGGDGVAPTPSEPADADGKTELEIAERALLRRLRGRSLSVAEARDVVREHEIEPDAIESLLERFQRLGYLDDVVLAEQLVHTGSDRKGQGRRVIAQTMTKRGIPRDVVDAVLAELPDDDDERALDFARSKAKSMASLDRDTALRRLSGQLARRGYGGSVALTAARTALDEVSAPQSGVRFR